MYFYLLFLPFQYTIFCYSSVNSLKKINFKWKGKTIFSQAAWGFFRILWQIDIFLKRLIICQNGITMNISNTWSVTVLSNLQFTLIISVLKKSCKNDVCSSDVCLSDMITSSGISLIIFFIKRFGLIKRLKVTPVFI